MISTFVFQIQEEITAFKFKLKYCIFIACEYSYVSMMKYLDLENTSRSFVKEVDMDIKPSES